jgi:hypothetical protein
MSTEPYRSDRPAPCLEAAVLEVNLPRWWETVARWECIGNTGGIGGPQYFLFFSFCSVQSELSPSGAHVSRYKTYEVLLDVLENVVLAVQRGLHEEGRRQIDQCRLPYHAAEWRANATRCLKKGVCV